jgi:hypothetical protein
MAIESENLREASEATVLQLQQTTPISCVSFLQELARVTKELSDEKALTFVLYQNLNQMNSVEEQSRCTPFGMKRTRSVNECLNLTGTHQKCDKATDTADLGFSQYGGDVERFQSPTFHEDFEGLRDPIEVCVKAIEPEVRRIITLA